MFGGPSLNHLLWYAKVWPLYKLSVLPTSSCLLPLASQADTGQFSNDMALVMLRDRYLDVVLMG